MSWDNLHLAKSPRFVGGATPKCAIANYWDGPSSLGHAN